jgi:GAF domain
MSADLAHQTRREREYPDDAAPARGHLTNGPFGPCGSPHVQLTDVVVSGLLKTRAARPPNLESENEFLHSLAQLLLTDAEHILARSIRAAVRLCGAGSAGISQLETDHGNEVFRWVALGGAFEGQEGRSTPRFFSPCGLAFDRQAPQLFAYPARYYSWLNDAGPEIVEALVLPIPDGMGTIWIASHDEALQFDSEHVRVLTGLATFMAVSLQLLRLTHNATRDPERKPRDATVQRRGTAAAASSGIGSENAFAVRELVAEARGIAPAAPRQGMPPVSTRTEIDEVAVAFRTVREQLRLVLRDSRRLVRRLVAACETSKRRGSVQTANSPAPLASVPLVVLRSTNEREQIELNDLALNLSAEGYQVARRGPQWVVYTEITDRRKSASGRSPQDSRGAAATSEPVSSGPLPHRRKDDDDIANAQNSVIAGHPGDTSRRQPPMFW